MTDDAELVREALELAQVWVPSEWDNADTCLVRDAIRAFARLTARLAAERWQPIETAPKDATIIEVLCGTGDVDTAQYDEDRRCAGEGPMSYFGPGWRSIESGLGILWEFEPTHWRPLPTPPETEG